MVKKIKQLITGWLRHPSVAVVIGCLKIGEGIRVSLEAVGFLRTRIPRWVGEDMFMSAQAGIYSAMAITAVFSIIVAMLAVRSRRWAGEVARQQQPRRDGVLQREKR